MRKKHIWYTILFCLAMEFQINIILAQSIGGMIGVFLLYSLIGLLTYYSFPYVINKCSSRHKGFWTALIAHGLAGVVIIEWGFMGNTLTSIPDPTLTVIAQLGMFAWWATIAAMPYLLRQPEGQALKKPIFIYYGVYAVVSTILAVPLGMAPVILIEPPVYLGFFYFYRKFAHALEAVPLAPSTTQGS